MTRQIEENKEKFRELVLYISKRQAFNKKFGAVKLNKILFYSDFLYFAKFGEPITGVQYRRLPKGPVPTRMMEYLRDMEQRRELVRQDVELSSGKVQKRTLNLREPDLSLFTAREIALVDGVMDLLRDLDAESVSELSHLNLGWRVAADREAIPYQSVFLRSDEPSPSDVALAARVAEEYGLVPSAVA